MNPSTPECEAKVKRIVDETLSRLNFTDLFVGWAKDQLRPYEPFVPITYPTPSWREKMTSRFHKTMEKFDATFESMREVFSEMKKEMKEAFENIGKEIEETTKDLAAEMKGSSKSKITKIWVKDGKKYTLIVEDE